MLPDCSEIEFFYETRTLLSFFPIRQQLKRGEGNEMVGQRVKDDVKEVEEKDTDPGSCRLCIVNVQERIFRTGKKEKRNRIQ